MAELLPMALRSVGEYVTPAVVIAGSLIELSVTPAAVALAANDGRGIRYRIELSPNGEVWFAQQRGRWTPPTDEGFKVSRNTAPQHQGLRARAVLEVEGGPLEFAVGVEQWP